MKTINKVNKVEEKGFITEMVEFNGKKFKIIAELRNGGAGINGKIMDGDGVFQYILTILDIDFVYSESYVSDVNRKTIDMEKGIFAMKKVIKKLY
jgi:hypothetical protein